MTMAKEKMQRHFSKFIYDLRKEES